MSEAVLTIEDLHLSFPIFRGEVHALNHVSLEIKRGEIVGVVGESGSGKSVTAMLTMRLLPEGSYRVHRGQVKLLGEDVLNASEKQLRQWRGAKVAMIFQEPMTALNPTRRIGKQMVEVIRQHQPLSRRDAGKKAITLLEEMQINEKTDSEIYTRLARRVGGENGEVLRRMAADEARHCEVWSRYTGKKAEAKRFKVFLYSVLGWIFGLTFVINLDFLNSGGKHEVHIIRFEVVLYYISQILVY